jgi:hypothetical protein
LAWLLLCAWINLIAGETKRADPEFSCMINSGSIAEFERMERDLQ